MPKWFFEDPPRSGLKVECAAETMEQLEAMWKEPNKPPRTYSIGGQSYTCFLFDFDGLPLDKPYQWNTYSQKPRRLYRDMVKAPFEPET